MVGRHGSIDWLALPRFDSAACFAALLGGPENGRWLIAPTAESRITRHYRQGTLVLETRFETADGAAILIDGMGRRDGCADLVRIIRGERLECLGQEQDPENQLADLKGATGPEPVQLFASH
jgi:hypothetical protein